MNREEKRSYAPLKAGVTAAALLAAVLLAGCVCALHWINAVSLRGRAQMDAYVQMQESGELALCSAAAPDARVYTLYADGEKEFGLHLAEPWLDRDVVHIEGTLLRPNQAVGVVHVRVGLVPEKEQEITLLNTQMVREFVYSGANGYDDHCGFSAAVQAKRMPAGECRVVIVDESDGVKRMIMTGMTVRLMEDGLETGYVNLPESEEEHAQ